MSLPPYRCEDARLQSFIDDFAFLVSSGPPDSALEFFNAQIQEPGWATLAAQHLCVDMRETTKVVSVRDVMISLLPKKKLPDAQWSSLQSTIESALTVVASPPPAPAPATAIVSSASASATLSGSAPVDIPKADVSTGGWGADFRCSPELPSGPPASFGGRLRALQGR